MTNTASATSPQDRRIDGINAVTVEFHPTIEVTPTAEVATAIRALTALGRAPRWKDAVESWAKLIEDETNPRPWALIQGSIWACHQA